MPPRRGLGARQGLGAGARARRLAAGSWRGRAVSFLAAAEAEPPPEHGKRPLGQPLLGLGGQRRGLSRWVPVPRNAVAALTAAGAGGSKGRCCLRVLLLQQKPPREQLTPAKTLVSRRLLRGVGAGRRSRARTRSLPLRSDLEGPGGLPRGWTGVSRLPWPRLGHGAQQWECQGVWGEALGTRMQILLHLPSEGKVGRGGGSPRRGRSPRISGKVKGNSLLCRQLLAGP